MELNSDLSNSILDQETSKVSDSINVEQDSFLETSINSNVNPTESAQNNKIDISQSENDNEPSEQIYQDILGSGDLMKKIIKQGTLDERPMKGEQIVINLIGHLEENDDIIEEKKNLEITLGDCEVNVMFKN